MIGTVGTTVGDSNETENELMNRFLEKVKEEAVFPIHFKNKINEYHSLKNSNLKKGK